ncbi:MAG: radical SAM protein [Candidatus Micrarchaeia archaeon]
MEKRVLLIYPSWTDVYGYAKPLSRFISFFIPLGLCYLASSLKKNGIDCEIIDCEAENIDIKGIIRKIQDYRPSVIGISSTSPTIDRANAIAKEIKDNFDIPVVLGGNHITLVGKEALIEHKFDFGIIGEGEEVFPKFIEAFPKGIEYVKQIPNIFIKQNGDFFLTYKDSKPLDLDLIPFPDRSKIKIRKYRRLVKDKVKVFTSVKASRGCPFGCYFCSENIIYPVKIRFRSVENILNELDEIADKFPEIEHVFFNDDTLTLKKSWINKLLDEIAKRKYKFTFEGETIVKFFDEQIAEKMVKAGFEAIFFGIESGDPEIIKNIGKGINLNQVKKAVKIAKSFGLATKGSVIIGHPFETKEKIKRTISFISSLDELDEVYVNIATPYPGTKLREMVEEGYGGLKLINKSYSSLSKYEPVIEIEGISAKELKKYQKIAILKFYSRPKRILSYIKRFSLLSILEMIKDVSLFIFFTVKSYLKEKFSKTN